MSLLDLFRKKGTAPATPQPVPVPAAPASQRAADPEPVSPASVAEAESAPAQPPAQQPEEPNVRVFDDFGREVLIPVSQWRRELLPHALQQAHSNPDALSAILLDALGTGATEEILPAAAHLQTIDPLQERGATVHGLTLLAAGKAAEAEDVFVTYLGQVGPSATVLTHLARAQAAQGRMDEADATLWRALEADPNDENAVGLYAARSREREGDFGWQTALERAATLPGAWLPLMFLGRSALDGRNRSLAVALYKQALERAGQPAPVLLLQGISGDLGQFGLAEDAIRLVRPAFHPEVHGLIVGNNLMRAMVDSGQPAEALALLRELGKLNRPELAEPLRSWEVEIRRRELAAQAAQHPPQPQLLRIDGPVWLPPNTPGRALFATAGSRRGTVLFLGSSVTMPEQVPEEAAAALADTAGRLSRALPLFLAENAYALLTLDTLTLVPWAEIAGFAMLNQPWPDDAAATYARDAGARVAVTAHLQATVEGATMTLRVIPVMPVDAAASTPAKAEGASEPGAEAVQPASPAALDEATIADRPAVPSMDDAELTPVAGAPVADVDAEVSTVTVSMTWAELHNGAQALWPQLAIHLVTRFGDTPEPPRAGRYAPPRGGDLNVYLRLLEQLLGINCAMSSRHAPLLVTGERETLRAVLDLAIRYPNSLPVRLMLGETLLRVRALHPEVLAEFMQPLRLLNERHPFPGAEAASLLAAQQAAAMNPQSQSPTQVEA